MIYYPKLYGTCAGADKAIDLAYTLRKEYNDKNIYIYKEILHNSFIINDLEKKNIKCIDDLSIVTPNDLLIIRAHGEPKSTYDYLNEHDLVYYDATCKNVLRIHELVEAKYNEHKNIIIIGKKNHPEVIGTNGWCDNEALIIESENDYNKIDKNKEYYIVCQTTIKEDSINELLSYMDKNNIKYDFDNTICNNQRIIQDYAVELAKQVDIMFVIGGKESSNTKELFNKCSKVCKSYYFSDINEFYNHIKKENYTLLTKIGITGGASTPKRQIYEYTHLLEFIIYYKSKLKELEQEMQKLNKQFINKKDNKLVLELINKFININQGGKYIRGCLIDLGYKVFKQDDYVNSLSLAYETFQTSILVHDDIIDNSNLRRGKETISYSYKKEFEEFIKNNDTHNSLALCIGDYGLFLANDIIIKKYKNDKNFPKLFEYYNNIVLNTIKGEIIDVYLPFKEQHMKNHDLSEDDILEIYRLKTSWYTIVGPFALGLILGGAKTKDIKEFETILEPLGIAFQIKDDILGIYSNNEVLGKPVFSDIEEFKQTILYSYIKLNKPNEYKELLKYYGQKGLSKDDAIKVQELIKSSGSLEYATNKMNELFDITEEKLRLIHVNDYVKNILLGLTTYLKIREK